MSSFRKSLTVTRQSASLVMGRLVQGDVKTFTIRASVQPASPQELETLPEGRRNKAAYRLYTDALLYIADPKTGVNSDTVTIYGDLFEVMGINTWKNGVLNHYKILVSKAQQ